MSVFLSDSNIDDVHLCFGEHILFRNWPVW